MKTILISTLFAIGIITSLSFTHSSQNQINEYVYIRAGYAKLHVVYGNGSSEVFDLPSPTGNTAKRQQENNEFINKVLNDHAAKGYRVVGVTDSFFLLEK